MVLIFKGREEVEMSGKERKEVRAKDLSTKRISIVKSFRPRFKNQTKKIYLIEIVMFVIFSETCNGGANV